MADRFAHYLLGLHPRIDTIKFCRPTGRCSPGLFSNVAGDSSDRGGGHIITPFYMVGRITTRLADRAICGVCGRPFMFAFWKLNGAIDYRPTAAELDDIRKLYADLKRVAKGGEPSYGLTWRERAAIHCHRCRDGLPCDGLILDEDSP